MVNRGQRQEVDWRRAAEPNMFLDSFAARVSPPHGSPPRDRWTRDRYHLNRDISGLPNESSTGSQLSRFLYGRFYKNSAC